MKMPGNMQAMMQQAQKMQQKMQEEIGKIRVEASAGGGIVTIAAGLLGLPAVAFATILASSLVPAVWSWMLAKRGPGDVPPIPR